MRQSGGLSGRDSHLDALRGLAILLVLLLHAGAMTPGLEEHRYLQIIFDRFAVGMQLFFVLSGYLISRSWASLRERPQALAIYAVKRVGKIVPLYMIVLHLNIALFLWISHVDPTYVPFRNSVSSETLTPLNYFAHLVFLQGFIPAWQNTLVDGSWSIVAEVYFYILFPLVFANRCTEPRRAFQTYLAALVIAMATVYLTRKAQGSYGYYNLINQLPCFLLGAFVQVLHRQIGAAAVLQRWAPSMIAFCAIAGLGMTHSSVSPLGVHEMYALVFATVLFALPYWQTGMAWVARREILKYMGRSSYGLFFAHLILLKLQYYVLVDRAGLHDFGLLFAANLLSSILGSLLLSGLLLDRIDRYCVGLASRLAKRLEGRPATATI